MLIEAADRFATAVQAGDHLALRVDPETRTCIVRERCGPGGIERSRPALILGYELAEIPIRPAIHLCPLLAPNALGPTMLVTPSSPAVVIGNLSLRTPASRAKPWADNRVVSFASPSTIVATQTLFIVEVKEETIIHRSNTKAEQRPRACVLLLFYRKAY